MNIHQSKLFNDSWNVAFRRKTKGILRDLKTPFIVINNPPHCWAADPFVIEDKGTTYIFAELYDSRRGRGVIGYCELLENDTWTEWRPVIIEPYHLSYPHVYRENNEIYMIPEANQSRTLYCYKAVEFPEKWEKLSPIRENVRYADTSLFQWKEHSFALTYDVENIEDYKLILLDLEHPEYDRVINLSDADYRRPAGRMDSEHSIRVAQNCRNGYGEGLIFYRYGISDENQYSEKQVAELTPNQINLSEKKYLCGMHTYNTSEHYEVIDIKTREFSLESLFGKVKRTIKRIMTGG